MTSRRTVIGNLVLIEGEMTLGTTANDGIDFSDYVSKIYDFQFYTYYNETDRRRYFGADSDLHTNSATEDIGQFTTAAAYDGNGRLLGGASLPMLKATGSSLSDGTHTGKSLTGQLSGQSNAEATVVVGGGRIQSCTVTNNGNFYYEREILDIEGGGTAVATLTRGTNTDVAYQPAWWPHLIDDTTVKIISFYSDNGVGGDFSTANYEDEKIIKFTLTGRR